MPSEPLSFGRLLPPPPRTRKNIPLYYDKSEDEFRDDPYERYDELVARQTVLHFADHTNGGYPFQPILDYLFGRAADLSPTTIVDVGCSVGRLLAEFATRYPTADCYGIDFSYQMLRQAHDYWKTGATLTPNTARYGIESPGLTGPKLDNVHFALARARQLPFPDGSIDLLFSTFLLDRVPDMTAALAEFKRVLSPGGTLLGLTPLNFLRPDQWRKYHPPIKIYALLGQIGFDVTDWVDPLDIFEPLDGRGNAVRWRTVAFAAT